LLGREANQPRLRLSVIAYNAGNLWRRLALRVGSPLDPKPAQTPRLRLSGVGSSPNRILNGHFQSFFDGGNTRSKTRI
jgi:hypothetical protein